MVFSKHPEKSTFRSDRSSSFFDTNIRSYEEGLLLVARANRFVHFDGLADTDRFSFEQYQRVSSLVEAALCRNASLTALRAGELALALEHAEAGVRAEPQSLKSKYRRAMALVALSRWEEAEKDFKEVVAKEPKNREARKLLSECQQAGSKKIDEDTVSRETSKVELKESNTCAERGTCGNCGVCSLWADCQFEGPPRSAKGQRPRSNFS